MLRIILFAFIVAMSAAPAFAADEEPIDAALHEEVIRVPLTVDGLFGPRTVNLVATVYRPDGKGPFPVVILSHGRAPTESGRRNIGRFRKIPQIREFIKRGYMVVVPVRRGYGATGGSDEEGTGTCGAPFYHQAGLEAAKDLLATIDAVRRMSLADAEQILLVGQSAGGFASLVTASLNPAGVIGVINLSGGRGGRPATHPGLPCSPEQMAEEIRQVSRTIRVPVLWHYSENDRYFSPQYVRQWFKAFLEAGGKGRLVMQPPFAKDGHSMFASSMGIPLWTKAMDAFLKEFGLALPAAALSGGK